MAIAAASTNKMLNLGIPATKLYECSMWEHRSIFKTIFGRSKPKMKGIMKSIIKFLAREKCYSEWGGADMNKIIMIYVGSVTLSGQIEKYYDIQVSVLWMVCLLVFAARMWGRIKQVAGIVQAEQEYVTECNPMLQQVHDKVMNEKEG